MSSEPASREATVLGPGLPSSKGFFHVTHEDRMGYRACMCQTKNLSTRNDKYSVVIRATQQSTSVWDDVRPNPGRWKGANFPGEPAEAPKMLLFPA